MVVEKPKLEKVGIGGIAGAFGCSTILIFPPVGTAIALSYYFNISNPYIFLPLGVVIGALPFILFEYIVAYAHNRSAMKKYREAKEKEEKEELRRAKDAEDAALSARRREIEYYERTIVENSLEALDALQSLPNCISTAKNFAESAAVHYKDGAFSPFWSDIEQAYSALADYRNAITAIGKAVDNHFFCASRIHSAGGDSRPYARFPVEFDQEILRKTLLEASEDLEKMVYEAQKQPVFAQIWEQRRTTSAVIAGFANLEIAVRDMSGALSGAIDYLAEEFVTSKGALDQFILTETRHSAHLLEANRQQAMALKEISNKVSDIRTDVYHQRWGN